MLNLLLQSHPVFIPMESLAKIWDFRLRPPARRGHRGLRPGGILDLWNRYALSIYNRQNSFQNGYNGIDFPVIVADFLERKQKMDVCRASS